MINTQNCVPFLINRITVDVFAMITHGTPGDYQWILCCWMRCKDKGTSVAAASAATCHRQLFNYIPPLRVGKGHLRTQNERFGRITTTTNTARMCVRACLPACLPAFVPACIVYPFIVPLLFEWLDIPRHSGDYLWSLTPVHNAPWRVSALCTCRQLKWLISVNNSCSISVTFISVK